MFTFRYSSDLQAPRYGSSASAAADLVASEDIVIAPNNGRAKVRTGVWIESVNWDVVPEGAIPELQIRARSGLAAKHGVMLSNGVGTVDADYRDEICVLLTNTGTETFYIQKGDRIAQMAASLTWRLPELTVGGERQGGFGSTGVKTTAS
jgi:dUTP pyrophosphatase